MSSRAGAGVGRRSPAGQQLQGPLGGRAGFGGVERHAQAVVGVERQRLVAELELADDRVLQALGARAVEAHVVRRPADAERLAAGRQLADEVLEVAVVRIATGLRAQQRDKLRREAVPVGVEVGRRRVQKREPRAVRGLLGAVEHRPVQRAAERVGGQVVAVDRADNRRRFDLVEEALHDGAYALLGRPRSPCWDRACGAGQVEEMRTLGVVELERPRQRVEDQFGDAADLAALQAAVVVRTDARQGRDLFTTKPRDPALAVARHAGLLGSDLCSSAGEELGDVVGGVHGLGRLRRSRRAR